MFDRMAEEKMAEAVRRGELDRLPGSGAPLPPDDLKHVPEELRAGYRMMRNAGMIPAELEMNKEIATMQDLLKLCEDEEQRGELRKRLTEKQLRYQLLLERQGLGGTQAIRTYETKLTQQLTGEDRHANGMDATGSGNEAEARRKAQSD
ncbi:DUF1992 domain-containing protein [Paenibacillus sp. IB182496]|uniref:DUF1992 domain-containing protein n=1 Tax=Paenibacillus sabuli TaxID=2772509 RepID=A0A927BU03_9BACL|nr:DUF1992 domain-containing protein [Paenibacillus sabuli]